jgi:hypothetical protein
MGRRVRHLNPGNAGAVLALDSRFIVGLSNGSLVSSWSDRSGLGNNASQATSSARPTFQTNRQGGQPGVRFDGSNVLNFSTAIISGSTPGSCLYVFRLDLDPPITTIPTGPVMGNFGSAADNSHSMWTDGRIYDGFGSTVRKSMADPMPRFTTSRIIAIHSASNDWQFFIDGSAFFTTVSNNVGWSSSPRIGGSGGFYFLLGVVMSVTVLNSRMSTSVRRRLEHASAFSFKMTCA